MGKEHQAEIIKTLSPYLLAFPQSKMTQEGLIVYARALQSLSVAQVDAAMAKLLRICKFFPTVAEIYEQAESVTEYVTDSRLPSPDEAWYEAMREAHDKFVYEKWELSTPEVEKAVDNFGKMALCELESDDMNTARAQFMRIYTAIIDRTKDRKRNEDVIQSLSQRHVNMLQGLSDKLALKA